MLAFRLLCSSAMALLLFTSCKNEKKTPPGDHDPVVQAPGQQGKDADTGLVIMRPVMNKELKSWISTFKDCTLDSFRQDQTSPFEQISYDEGQDMEKFYSLYKPALSYSPDSMQFIDLYSEGLSLEKKGKKIIAAADVDMAVTLCNLKEKKWMRIASFGPSANIEEAVWISGNRFILAGTLQGDNGEVLPIILVGDTGSQSFRWFQAKCIRPSEKEYQASGLVKLKIDEWE